MIRVKELIVKFKEASDSAEQASDSLRASYFAIAGGSFSFCSVLEIHTTYLCDSASQIVTY